MSCFVLKVLIFRFRFDSCFPSHRFLKCCWNAFSFSRIFDDSSKLMVSPFDIYQLPVLVGVVAAVDGSIAFCNLIGIFHPVSDDKPQTHCAPKPQTRLVDETKHPKRIAQRNSKHVAGQHFAAKLETHRNETTNWETRVKTKPRADWQNRKHVSRRNQFRNVFRNETANTHQKHTSMRNRKDVSKSQTQPETITWWQIWNIFKDNRNRVSRQNRERSKRVTRSKTKPQTQTGNTFLENRKPVAAANQKHVSKPQTKTGNTL